MWMAGGGEGDILSGAERFAKEFQPWLNIAFAVRHRPQALDWH
jgi:hypothetical protein